MKLAHSDIREVLEIQEGEIYSVVVENPRFFYEIVKELKLQIDGSDGRWVLSENEKPLMLKNRCELIFDYIDFKANKKTLISKIVGNLAEIALDNQHIDSTTELLSQIERHIYCLAEQIDIDLFCDDFTIQQIIKTTGISVALEGENLVEIIYSYMRVVREILGDRLFVFINLKTFVSEKDLVAFCETVRCHDYKVVFFDNKIYDLPIEEKHLIIDNDLCEI